MSLQPDAGKPLRAIRRAAAARISARRAAFARLPRGVVGDPSLTIH